MCRRITSQPPATPMATPPAPTSTNIVLASRSENAPVVTAATANRSATSADASFSRLSPSRMVVTSLGTRTFCVTAMAATASGGETIAPSTHATAHGIPTA